MELARVVAVLFDMDGTLVDSDAAVARAWRTWTDEYAVEPLAWVSIANGRLAADTVRRLQPDLGVEAVAVAAARQLSLQYHDLSDVVAAPGALALLSLLYRFGLPWAVMTSADHRLAAARLHAAGVSPPILVTEEDVTNGKPAPEGHLLAARRLGVEPKHCLVVEDAEPGAAAGRATDDMVTALKKVPADLQVDDLLELAQLLAETFTAT